MSRITPEQIAAYRDATENFTDAEDLLRRLSRIVETPRLLRWLMVRYPIGQRHELDLDAESPSGKPWREYIPCYLGDSLEDYHFDVEGVRENPGARRLSTIRSVTYGPGKQANAAFSIGPMCFDCWWRFGESLDDPPKAPDMLAAALLWEPVFLPMPFAAGSALAH
jgi:hypothetical protein